MKHPGEYRGEEVVILGMAKSGQAVAKVFHDFGALVTVNDAKQREECAEADELEALGVRVVCGGHPGELLHPGVKLIVKNPGIPYTIPIVEKAAELGIEIVTEVEVAWHICPGPIIGVTGSNGKTTTATWVGTMLEKAGMNPIVAGNIGRPLCDAAGENTPDQWLVVELSSFQLKGTQQFRPRIACLLNVYETHLDYHGDMDDYVESKLRLFANQTADDVAVLNVDDEVCRSLIGQIAAHVLPFSTSQLLDYGFFVCEQRIVYRDRNGNAVDIAAVGEIGIPGKHNIENALAATAIAITAGVPVQAIAEMITAFRGVEHRQEFVRELDGVLFYNDSKATNPSATVKALDAFDAPIIWIGGGLDRGMDYIELQPWFEKKVETAVLIGETKNKLQQVAEKAGLQSVVIVDTASNAADALDQAVRYAFAAAKSGDVILFSPACASWDMFTSFEERGSMFKASVHNL